MPAPFHHVDLALHTDVMAVVANASCQLFGIYLSDLERNLKEWKVAINFSSNFAMLCVRAGRHMPNPRPLMLFGEPVCWVDTLRCLVVILDTRLNWSTHVDQFRKKAGALSGFSVVLQSSSSTH